MSSTTTPTIGHGNVDFVSDGQVQRQKSDRVAADLSNGASRVSLLVQFSPRPPSSSFPPDPSIRIHLPRPAFTP